MSAPPKLQPAVLYADEDLLVVNKPAGWLVGPGNPDIPGVPDALRGHGDLAPDEPFEIVHRVDPGISGAIVYARRREIAQQLRAILADHTLIQTFRCLVQGYLQQDGTIDLPIYYDKRRGRLAASARRGTPARTAYKIIERVAGHTWIECRIVAGRAEQLRTHLAAIDHPLAVDPAFGNEAPLMLSRFKADYRPSRRHDERPLVARLTLHLARVEFAHPRTGQSLRIEAPLPKDLRTTLRQLGRLG